MADRINLGWRFRDSSDTSLRLSVHDSGLSKPLKCDMIHNIKVGYDSWRETAPSLFFAQSYGRSRETRSGRWRISSPELHRPSGFAHCHRCRLDYNSFMADNGDLQQEILQKTLREVADEESQGDPCVICLETVTEPSIAVPCRHTNFDYLCLISWLEQQPNCPLCMGLSFWILFAYD